MNVETLKKKFLKYCEKNNYEKNTKQLNIIDLLIKFINPKKKFYNFFFKNSEKLCFYLHGNVGVGKTMILNFFFDSLDIPKQRLHFNEFMINFHDHCHNKKMETRGNSILSFVKSLKINSKLIYLDEFQVTNIVDAMILGKLFDTIFNENIKVLITSNIMIDDLYKDGLQRDQFIPFLKIIKKKSIEKKLTIDDDYRLSISGKTQRFFYPLNEKTSFKINLLFRKLTKNKKLSSIKLEIKGREFFISNFYEGTTSFDFKTLCDANIGAEDYIKIADQCKFIVIKNVPNFSDENSNQQQRFITLIDIIYEKKIPLIISAEVNLKKFNSSFKLSNPFKRTQSRLFELTLL